MRAQPGVFFDGQAADRDPILAGHDDEEAPEGGPHAAPFPGAWTKSGPQKSRVVTMKCLKVSY